MTSYIKVFCDMSETVDELSDAEAGRLFKALLHYGNAETVDSLPGQERIVFRVLKATIDREREAYNRKMQAQRENGKKGGRPINPTKPNETQDNPTKPKKTTGFQKNPNAQKKDKDNIPPYNPPTGDEGGGGDDGDGLLLIAQRNNAVYDAAERAGFPRNTATIERLTDLISVHGADAVEQAIGECVTYGKSNLAYLAAVLRGKDKPRRSEIEDITGGLGWL